MKSYLWNELISLAKNYKKIIVTGCQRTGTTIFGYAISRELNYNYLVEENFNGEDVQKFDNLFNIENNVVFQAPALLHVMPRYQDKALIIVIERNPKEVVKSMLRVDWFWSCGVGEYTKYSKYSSISKPRNPMDLYNVKMDFANTFNNVRINYDEIKNTKYYVEDRKDFKLKQITKE